MKKRSIPCDIGFADGMIQSYRKIGDVLDVHVKAWNDRQIDIRFVEVVRLLDNDAGEVCDFCEVMEKSTLFQAAIDHVYEMIPENIPYRHFQFIGIDGDSVLDVVAEAFSIEVERA